MDRSPVGAACVSLGPSFSLCLPSFGLGDASFEFI